MQNLIGFKLIPDGNFSLINDFDITGLILFQYKEFTQTRI